MRSVLALALLATACAGSPNRGVLALDEFQRLGGAITCISSERPAPEAGYLRCLRIGPARVGAQYDELASRFPAEHATQANGKATAHIFALDERPGTETYLAVSERQGTVSAVQLTGTDGGDLHFAGVHLGDPAAAIEARLGLPAAIRRHPDYDLWTYGPFPFSFEVRGGRVYSMKVWAR